MQKNKKGGQLKLQNLSCPHDIQGIGGFSAKFFVVRGVRRTCVRRASKTEKENDFVFVEKFVEFPPFIPYFLAHLSKSEFFCFLFVIFACAKIHRPLS